MSATLNLHKVHLHSSHKRAAHTNFYHEFSLVRVFLEFRGVSLLKLEERQKDLLGLIMNQL